MLQEGFRLSKLQPARIKSTQKDLDYLLGQMSVVLEGDLATLQINFELIYRKCQLVCLTNRQDLLNRVVLSLEKYIATSLNQIQRDYVSKVNSLFQEFQEKVYLISNLFLFLKEDFIKIALKKFKEILIRNELLSKTLSTNIIKEIENHRDHQTIDLVLIRSIIKIFIQLEIYFQIFDTKFLQESKEYYAKEAQLKLDSLGPLEYINHVEERLRFESSTIIQNDFGYLDQATKRPLLVIIEQSFIHKYASKTIGFFNQFADQKQYLEIARLYKLFSKTSDLGLFKLQISKYILESCDKLLDTCAETEMIENLLSFQSHISEIIRVGCLENVEMMNQSKESFSICINKKQNKPAELIALYIDKLLKKSKGLNDTEIDLKLDQLVFLFRLIQGKDVFEAFYGKSLAKRLLLEKSASVDLEKSMLVKLQCECGPGFTQKLEGMFKDIDLSKEIMSGFQEAHKFQSRIQDFEFNVNTLTASFWPSYPINELVLPEKVFCFD
jgi:cullin-4